MQQILSRMSAVWCVIVVLPAVAVLGFSPSVYAGGFHLELAYCDAQSGPLTISPTGDIPLPDGCLGQVIEHLADGPVARPDRDGNPSGGDRLLVVPNDHTNRGSNGIFRVNGAQRLQATGYFMIDPALEGHRLPEHPVYVRIWNAQDPKLATYYYETPLYEMNYGTQQMNFGRDQLTIYSTSGAMDVKPNGDAVPVEFNVLSSYPNPFNAEATLTYALTEQARVAIALYDVQGRRAAELVNGEIDAGAHNIHFNASNLPTGAYFAVLKVNGANVSTRRMMLLK